MIKDAYRFLIPLLVLAVVAVLLRLWALSAIGLLLAAFVGYFFRNPVRKIPEGGNLIVSPADGRVVKVARLSGAEGEEGGQSISIFLNVFDVHVNRAPIGGRLEKLEYKRGKFKVAYDEQASQVNEQNVLTILSESGRVVVKQIAGIIARRVVCWKKPGHMLERGEVIGLIRFGSRVDVLLPKEVTVRVKVDDRVKGGSSILGEWT